MPGPIWARVHCGLTGGWREPPRSKKHAWAFNYGPAPPTNLVALRTASLDMVPTGRQENAAVKYLLVTHSLVDALVLKYNSDSLGYLALHLFLVMIQINARMQMRMQICESVAQFDALNTSDE